MAQNLSSGKWEGNVSVFALPEVAFQSPGCVALCA